MCETEGINLYFFFQQILEEGIARQNVIKSTYENRISKLEKERTESQAERDRLTREVELLSQRITALQRQLHTQQVNISN